MMICSYTSVNVGPVMPVSPVDEEPPDDPLSPVDEELSPAVVLTLSASVVAVTSVAVASVASVASVGVELDPGSVIVAVEPDPVAIAVAFDDALTSESLAVPSPEQARAGTSKNIRASARGARGSSFDRRVDDFIG